MPDPDALLQGEGRQNRFVRLPDVDALRTAGVQSLIRAAAGLEPPFMPGSEKTIVRSVSVRQRPRRHGATGSG